MSASKLENFLTKEKTGIVLPTLTVLIVGLVIASLDTILALVGIIIIYKDISHYPNNLNYILNNNI